MFNYSLASLTNYFSGADTRWHFMLFVLLASSCEPSTSSSPPLHRDDSKYTINSSETVYAVAWHPRDTNIIAIGGKGKRIEFWDVEKREMTKCMSSLVHDVQSIAFADDGRVLVVGDGDGNVLTVDMDTLEEVCRQDLHGHSVVSVAIYNEIVATASLDSSIRVWKLSASNLEAQTCLEFASPVRAVAISSNRIATSSGSDDETVLLMYDRPSLKLKHKLTGDRDQIMAIQFSPDGKLLLSAGAESVIRVRSADSAEEVQLLKGHRSSVKAILMLSDNKTVFSGGVDGTVRRWKLGDGDGPLQTLSGHTRSICALAVSPSEKWIASASFDKTVKIWKVGDK